MSAPTRHERRVASGPVLAEQSDFPAELAAGCRSSRLCRTRPSCRPSLPTAEGRAPRRPPAPPHPPGPPGAPPTENGHYVAYPPYPPHWTRT